MLAARRAPAGVRAGGRPANGPRLSRKGEGGTPRPAQVMGSKLRYGWAGARVENFVQGQAWARPSGRGQMGREQLLPGPRGAHPFAAWPGVGCQGTAGGMLEPFRSSGLCAAPHQQMQRQRHASPLPTPQGQACALTGRSLSRLRQAGGGCWHRGRPGVLSSVQFRRSQGVTRSEWAPGREGSCM